MVIGIIGENCSGKSTLAESIQKALGGEIVTGKDYLRLAKSESEARMIFQNKLKDAVSGSNVIYVISEPEHLFGPCGPEHDQGALSESDARQSARAGCPNAGEEARRL